MTPLHLEILLHYHCSMEPYPRASGVADQYLRDLIDWELLKEENGVITPTGRGKCHIQAILAMEFPRWVSPAQKPNYIWSQEDIASNFRKMSGIGVSI